MLDFKTGKAENEFELMKRVLYLTPVYPPYNIAASLRALGITTELSLNNIECIVVTKYPKTAVLTPLDLTLNKKIPPKIQIIHIFDFEILRKLCGALKLNNLIIPDDRIDWVLYSFPILVSKLKGKSFDFIYTTGPPFSFFILGLLLKFVYKKPLIVEYRDPWVNNPYDFPVYSHKNSLSSWLEKKILKKADYKIFVSNQLRDFVLKNANNLDKNAIVIQSGIDFKDYNNIQVKKEPSDTLRFVITCTIYGKRNPYLFFSLIRKALDSNFFEGINFSIDIYGGFNKKNMQEIIEKFALARYINLIFHPSHQMCLFAQKNADLLVDLSEKDVDYPTFPYHLWEYIASGRKILFIGKSDSFKAKFIEKNQYGYVLPSENPTIMKECFFNLLTQQKKKKLIIQTNIDEKTLMKLSWNKIIHPLLFILKK